MFIMSNTLPTSEFVEDIPFGEPHINMEGMRSAYQLASHPLPKGRSYLHAESRQRYVPDASI